MDAIVVHLDGIDLDKVTTVDHVHCDHGCWLVTVLARVINIGSALRGVESNHLKRLNIVEHLLLAHVVD